MGGGGPRQVEFAERSDRGESGTHGELGAPARAPLHQLGDRGVSRKRQESGITKGQEKTSRGNGYVYYLDFGNFFRRCGYIYQNLPNCILSIYAVYCIRFYLNGVLKIILERKNIWLKVS